MMAESTQHKLDRIRPPRVQITYDVETGGAMQKKELPFVVGIMSDLAGNPAEPLPKLKDRKFVEIDRDNFNDVMASIAPRLVFRADNRLSNDDSKLNVELQFSHMNDFHPVNVLQQVQPLRKLFEARQRLTDLLTKLDGNDALDTLLQEIVENTEGLQTIKAEVGRPNGAGAEDGAAREGDSAPRA
jgi:type VI secretion system protein ImpB